jgi:hypothetical protein
MDTEAARSYVELLLDYQFDMLWPKPWGLNHAEFLFVQTAETIRSRPELREWFMVPIELNVHGAPAIDGTTANRPAGYVLPDFILYFAHISRWPEISDLATRVRGTPADVWHANLIDTWSEKITSALSDQWEDRELYSFTGAASAV